MQVDFNLKHDGDLPPVLSGRFIAGEDFQYET